MVVKGSENKEVGGEKVETKTVGVKYVGPKGVTVLSDDTVMEKGKTVQVSEELAKKLTEGGRKHQFKVAS